MTLSTSPPTRRARLQRHGRGQRRHRCIVRYLAWDLGEPQFASTRSRPVRFVPSPRAGFPASGRWPTRPPNGPRYREIDVDEVGATGLYLAS